MTDDFKVSSLRILLKILQSVSLRLQMEKLNVRCKEVRLTVFVPMDCSRPGLLSFTVSWSLLRLMSIELVMPSNHLIFCHPLIQPSIFPSVKVFSNESVLHIRGPKYWNFSFSISPSNEYSETKMKNLITCCRRH